jgi:hypothetical protein
MYINDCLKDEIFDLLNEYFLANPPSVIVDLSGIDAKLDIIDTNVDDIETLTNTIDDKVDIIDTNVDDIETLVNTIDSKADIIDTTTDNIQTDTTHIISDIHDFMYSHMPLTFTNFNITLFSQNTSTAGVIVTGTGFIDYINPTIVISGTLITITDIVFINTNQLTCTVVVGIGVGVGARNATLTNHTGNSVTKLNALTIIP